METSLESGNTKRGRRQRLPKIVAGEEQAPQMCSADHCLMPSGEHKRAAPRAHVCIADELTTWLQCEGGCEKWYHIVCVGVSKDAVHTIDSYKCYKFVACRCAARSPLLFE